MAWNVRKGPEEFFRRNQSTFYMGFIALMISSVGDLAAGATLGFMTNTLALLPGLMVLIPPAIGMRGNIFGALGSRLGTSMHLGTFEMSLKRGSLLRQNMTASLILTVIVSCLMGLLAKFVSEMFGISSIPVEQFIFISVLGGTLAGLLLVLVNVAVANIGYRHNWDIDNISAPIITAAGDIITLPMLFVSAWIVLYGGSFAPMVVTSVAIFSIAVTAGLGIYIHYMRPNESRRIIVHSIPALIVCTLLDIAAGLTIESELESFLIVPALLVMIPPFLEDANALGGILTSRLSSMLHMGTITPGRFPDKTAWENFAIIYVFAFYVFILLGITSYLVATALGRAAPSLFLMVLLSHLAGLITITALNFISYYVAISAFRFSLDPDDHSIPFTSSAIDFIGAAALIVTVGWLGIA